MAEQNKYFKKFPFMDYNGTTAVNIMKRADFNSKVKNFFTAFNPYSLGDQDLVDHVAHDYYNDVDLDWVIHYANDSVDPYFNYHLDSQKFERYIKNKYGSAVEAKKKIVSYRNNWRGDESLLSPDGYNSLPGERKKYWVPIDNAIGVISYQRAEEDWFASTNKVETISFSTTPSTTFTKDETITDDSNSENKATISFANTSTITIRDIRGTFESNTNITVTGETSGVTATLDHTTWKLITHVIPFGEQIYYSPLYAYDYEFEQNELKREIYLLEPAYTEKVNKQLSDLLQ